jgi:phosphate:Na+ symporter
MIEAFGGLGFFLLGMSLMTDGLHGLAGNSMRKALTRFTHSPLSGALTGTCSTALLQSSTATTVATIGFVSASLLTFPQGLGIVLGANVGTTVTGWLVALLGFKLKLGTLALGLVGIGALIRLFGQGKLRHLGLAIAGFGAIFVGINFIQSGMLALSEYIDFSGFTANDWLDRLLLVLVGIITTVITQSSSAGVAMTLAALNTNTISLEQGCALIIGMDVGTTATAAIATIGGSIHARRTGFSHVIYNLLTGLMAFLLITPFLTLINTLDLSIAVEFTLVAFHSSFNILGVALVLPFASHFAQLITRLFPSDDRLTQKLDRQLLQQPSLAITAVEISLRHQLSVLLQHLRSLLSNHKPPTIGLVHLQTALDETQQYLDDVHLDMQSSKKQYQQASQQFIYCVNILDHLQRLHERCEEDADRAQLVSQRDELKAQREALLDCIEQLINAHQNNQWQHIKLLSETLAEQFKTQHQSYREVITQQISFDKIDIEIGIHYLQAARWLERVSHHLARICKHLNEQQDDLIKINDSNAQ